MKNRKCNSRVLSVLLVLMMTVVMAFSFAGCQAKKTEAPAQATSQKADEKTVSFKFVVVDQDGKEQSFDITTSEKTVGAALLKEGLIEGDEGEYGLYVKKVNGIEADYDKGGVYWAFYIGDEYATTGVDITDIEDGKTYSFKVEKG